MNNRCNLEFGIGSKDGQFVDGRDDDLVCFLGLPVGYLRSDVLGLTKKCHKLNFMKWDISIFKLNGPIK